jgi:penicillin-binding protein 1A
MALLAVGALAAASGGLLFWLWTRELPAFDTLKDYRPLVATRALGSDGSEVFSFARERRTVVPIEQIPEVLKQAVISAEDARFYKHEGINYLAMFRCVARGVLSGRVRCGGSTITQQVVKTFLLSKDWKYKRKVKELVLAPRLEQNLKKDEILWLYLNQIYLGHRRYGVEEASRYYFGKPVTELTLGEAAALAGTIQSPARLSPVSHPAAAKARQTYVLRRMAEDGHISARQAEAEIARPIAVAPPEPEPPGASYADVVRRYLDARYGADRVETEGLVVKVAMDPTMQRLAEAALEADLRLVDRRQGWRGPLLTLTPEQLAAALPAWRERLGTAPAPGGPRLVWDLAAVDPDELDHEPDAAAADPRRMIRVVPLAVDGQYAALVTTVDDRRATLDLGGATGTLPFADVAWARKWNPASSTAPPRSLRQVLAAGDVVLVRVLPSATPPESLARAGKPVPLSLEQRPRVQGALVAIDPVSRQVRALVGGAGALRAQFNRATQARRQPGSSFKAFVWGAAIESRRFTPATVVYDTPDLYRDPWTGKEWKPRNFERDQFDGPMLLKGALAHSKNTVAVKLTDALGPDAVIDFARRMGIESDLPRNLTLALGTGEVTPLELTNGYASIAAQGRYLPPAFVLEVSDRDGNLLESWQPPTEAPAPLPMPATALRLDGTVPAEAGGGPVLQAGAADPGVAAAPPEFTIPSTGTRAEVAYVLTDMLREVVESGTGLGAKALGRPTAAKTGTAQEHRDAWFVGYTPDLVAGVWIGFDDHGPLGPHETGGGAALPAWLAFMSRALGDRPALEFLAPEGVQFARIDPATGLLAAARPGQPEEAPMAFVAGTAPTEAVSTKPASPPQNFFLDDR